jgi:hypothetical protein
MNFNSIDDIRVEGFDGFATISALQKSKCGQVPSEPGVYMVLRPNAMPPEFCSESKGGHFKDRDPTVKVICLKSRWVEDVLVLYIGKAGSLGGTATLRSRLKAYMRFGEGEKVGHWGGRYVWQLQNSSRLLVCWKATEPNSLPRNVEKKLIGDFEQAYGKPPFANINR